MKRSEFFINSGDGNPRNSEGSFVTLNDGRILFVYSRYTGESREDNADCDLASTISADGGKTWSTPEIMFRHNPDEGNNLMSVSLLRLQSGRILLVYCAKKEIPGEEYPAFITICRYSDDEAATWSEAKKLTSARYNIGGNNDRLIQLKNGRIIMPVFFIQVSRTPKGQGFYPVLATTLYSDDNGENWYESGNYIFPPQNCRSGTQEPGIVELNDGRLLMWMRTDLLCQYHCYSSDQGETWSQALPWKYFPCTVTPLSIKRDPVDGKLIGIWSDGDPRWGVKIVPEDSWDRTPFAMSVSRDDGKTWGEKVLLEDDPRRGYCYTAMLFTDEALLLAYCCGGHGHWPLQDMKIVRLPRNKESFTI